MDVSRGDTLPIPILDPRSRSSGLLETDFSVIEDRAGNLMLTTGCWRERLKARLEELKVLRKARRRCNADEFPPAVRVVGFSGSDEEAVIKNPDGISGEEKGALPPAVRIPPTTVAGVHDSQLSRLLSMAAKNATYSTNIAPTATGRDFFSEALFLKNLVSARQQVAQCIAY
eukprot:CAMPEP_0177770798 /NCGR_PEP_ID=MMETSP0491_2-20121128/11160_1 /TAXON_ID=63592 /ORGANISM="Tetraselmis chuii, Strain PLY429" /LENGTH=171 /DNA_ID=CAMNT_0019288123 /DNA_START=340 /DNA_END=855 /DNA_ORIENTATION=+